MGLPLCCDVGFIVCVFSFLSTDYLGNRLHSRQSLLLCVGLVVVLSLFYSFPFGMVNTCLAPEQNLYLYPSLINTAIELAPEQGLEEKHP